MFNFFKQIKSIIIKSQDKKEDMRVYLALMITLMVTATFALRINTHQQVATNSTASSQGTSGSNTTFAPTVTLPAIPSISVPSLPNVTLPNLPKIQLPTLPNISAPSLPKVQLPTLPNISAPSLPKVQLPTLPNISAPSLPNVTLPNLPTLPNISAPALPNIPNLPSLIQNANNPGNTPSAPVTAAQVATALANLSEEKKAAFNTWKSNLIPWAPFADGTDKSTTFNAQRDTTFALQKINQLAA